MSWVSTDCIPAQLSIAAIYSNNAGNFNDQVIKIAPLSSAGGVFDMTGLASLTLIVDSGTLGVTAVSNQCNPTILTADPTGLTFKLSGADLSNLTQNVGLTQLRASLVGTNSSNQLLASGTLTVKNAP